MVEVSLHALYPDHTLLPILGCDTTVFYRNKMDFSFGQKDNSVYLGLKEKGQFDRVVPLETCQTQSPKTIFILQDTAQFFSDRHYHAWDQKNHTGMLRYLVMRHSKTTNHFLLTLVVAKDSPDYLDYAAFICNRHPEISGVCVGIHDGRSDRSFVPDATCIFGKDSIEEHILGNRYTITGPSFFQTNTYQAAVLYRVINDWCEASSHDTVLDLYCGTGTIGLSLAKKVGNIIGVDDNPANIKLASYNQEQNTILNASFVLENVKNFLKFSPIKANWAIVDPPRDGLIPKALRRIAERKIQHVIYVSCNLKTLFRDIKLLSEYGYILQKIQPIDMFPHTDHIETVVKLTFKGPK